MKKIIVKLSYILVFALFIFVVCLIMLSGLRQKLFLGTPLEFLAPKQVEIVDTTVVETPSTHSLLENVDHSLKLHYNVSNLGDICLNDPNIKNMLCYISKTFEDSPGNIRYELQMWGYVVNSDQLHQAASDVMTIVGPENQQLQTVTFTTTPNNGTGKPGIVETVDRSVIQ